MVFRNKKISTKTLSGTNTVMISFKFRNYEWQENLTELKGV